MFPPLLFFLQDDKSFSAVVLLTVNPPAAAGLHAGRDGVSGQSRCARGRTCKPLLSTQWKTPVKRLCISKPPWLESAFPGGLVGPAGPPKRPGTLSCGSRGGGERSEETSSPLAPGQGGCSCILGVEWSTGSVSISALFFGGAT